MARPRRISLLAAVCALAVLTLGAAPAQAVQLGLPEPHSPNAEGISTSYWVMIAVTIGFLVAINVALIVAVVRFRERRGEEPRRYAAGRGALRPVAGVLGLTALGIFIFGVVMTTDIRKIEPTGAEGLGSNPTAQVGVKDLPPADVLEGEQSTTGGEPTSGSEPTETAPLQINAIAQQWLWRFEYPGGQPGQRTFSYGELVVPVDTAVVLNIDSTDVVHSWWVPALGGQVQAVPGDVTQTWFKADEVGRYEGRSTVFSGSAYPAMRAWVRVVTAPEYEAYISDLEADLSEAQGIVAEEAARAGALTPAAEASP